MLAPLVGWSDLFYNTAHPWDNVSLSKTENQSLPSFSDKLQDQCQNNIAIIVTLD